MFKLHSEFKPGGDQPQAIEKLVDGIKKVLKGTTNLQELNNKILIY